MSRTLDLDEFINPDKMARDIAIKFQTWDNFRSPWVAQKQEIQEYIFATDTKTTTNSALPWKNKVHIPKLCQIRDNLHANYMAALNPNDSSIIWEGDDTDSETKAKRRVIQSYMQNKLNQAGFWNEVSKLVYDYIDYGNVFAMPVFEANYVKDSLTQTDVAAYIGPKLHRINPVDICFDPTAETFEEAPKIIRSLKTIGSLKADLETKPELGYYQDIFDKMVELRGRFAAHSQGDFRKNQMYQYSGFTGFWEYYNSDYVEILDFYGDFYDKSTGDLYRNYLLSVVDRAFVIRKQASDNWLGIPPIRHAGWRLRQDNLYAMGPLDNLVGLQYRIDHLENAKSDAIDLFIHPVTVVKGEVADFDFGPGERIYVGEDGDVKFMPPDPSFMAADTQIRMYEDKMEEMAGAPKQAMGFRTPGEKTAYEVQTLENSANRIFVNKTSYFEEIFLEPLLNDMLELVRRNLNENDVIRVIDDETQAVTFETITREDITAKGKIRPVGARHFAQNAQILQNLTAFSQSPLGQNPMVMAHISSKKLVLAVETLLGIEKYKIVQDYIGLYEQAEAKQIEGSLQQVGMEQQTAGMPPGQAQAAMIGQLPNGQQAPPPKGS